MTIEEEYRARVDALAPHERVARSAAMFQWTREMIGRQILEERRVAGAAEITAEELKWRIALRMYADEPPVVALIHRRLAELGLTVDEATSDATTVPSVES